MATTKMTLCTCPYPTARPTDSPISRPATLSDLVADSCPVFAKDCFTCSRIDQRSDPLQCDFANHGYHPRGPGPYPRREDYDLRIPAPQRRREDHRFLKPAQRRLENERRYLPPVPNFARVAPLPPPRIPLVLGLERMTSRYATIFQSPRYTTFLGEPLVAEPQTYEKDDAAKRLTSIPSIARNDEEDVAAAAEAPNSNANANEASSSEEISPEMEEPNSLPGTSAAPPPQPRPYSSRASLVMNSNPRARRPVGLQFSDMQTTRVPTFGTMPVRTVRYPEGTFARES